MAKRDDRAELAEMIRTFRGIEMNEDAIPVLGDEDAMRVLAAWQKTDQKWRPPKRRAPELVVSNQSEAWQWLVDGWTIDVGAVARACGLSPRTTDEKLAMLVANRLIYPDGSLAKGARTALQLHISAKLGIKQKPPKPPKGDGAKPDNN